ncbi:baseplate J/gp47 family protein [Chitiniphilus eburneus]|uniref:baseplate J/gp47 family protein n=1 Tax=Chitiniphilus eburneus TaxID=2571148 RepID=UPI0035CF3BBB
MPFNPPPFADIRAALLRDLQNQLPQADIGPDSDYYVRASSVASAVEGLYQHQAWIVRQIFPDTADTAYLELHARVRGLSRKPPVAALGTLQVTGVPGAAVPVGLALLAGAQRYTTTAASVIDAGGVATVTAAADVAGTAANLGAPLAATLNAAPAGVASQAVLLTMVGGVDTETDAALLARLLELIRRPPAGGNRYDYRRWALEVPGVTAAYVYPLRRGLGTVDVVVTAADGLPSAETLAAVQEYIDDVRPVTARNCLILAPTPRVVNVVAHVALSGLTPAAAEAQIRAAVEAYFAALAPGERCIRSRIEALVSDVPGVVDRALSQPAANVNPVVDPLVVEWVRLGTLTVGAL